MSDRKNARMKNLSHEHYRQRRLILKTGVATAAFANLQSMGSTVSPPWERASLNISYPHNFHREFDDFELMLS